MAGVVSVLIDAIRDSRSVFWAGTRPPRFDMVCSAAIYDPVSDFRVPASYHQQFDLAFLVESDLGAFKQWPVILDEAMRLLAPNGILVLRSRQETFVSKTELISAIWKWAKGQIEVVARHITGADITFAFRLATSKCRSYSAEAWSFALITDGADPAGIVSFVECASRLRTEGGLDAEVLVCGPTQMREVLGAYGGEAVFIEAPPQSGAAGWRTRAKNMMVAAATRENVMLTTDGFVPRSDFADAVRAFGGDFDLLVPSQLTRDGTPMPDWVMTNDDFGRGASGWLDHGDYHPLIYPSDSVTVGKRALFGRLRWNEGLSGPHDDQVELARRLQDDGVTIRLARRMTVLASHSQVQAAASFRRIPWLDDVYASTGARWSTPFKQPTEEVTSDFYLNLTGSKVVAREHGLVFPRAWQKGPRGYTWSDVDDPTLSIRLVEQAGDAQVSLGFAETSAVVERVTLNGQLSALTVQESSASFLRFLLKADQIPSSGNMHLRLHRRDTASPVTLRDITLQGVKRKPNCTLGVPISLGGRAETVLQDGWNEPEAWGVWAARAEANLKLRVPDAQQRDLRLRLGMQIALLSELETAQITVIVNGTTLASVSFEINTSRQDIDVCVPSIHARYGELMVTLKSDRVVPASLSGNADDTRRLGVGLVTVLLDEAPGAPALSESALA